MAIVSLYADKNFKENKQKFKTCELDTSGIWYIPEQITNNFDYVLNFWAEYNLPTTEGTFFTGRIHVETQGVNKINDVGDTLIKCPDLVITEHNLTYEPEFEEQQENTVFYNDYFYGRDYNNYGVTGKQYKPFLKPGDDPIAYRSSNSNFSSRHFYTFAGYYFPVKHTFSITYNGLMGECVSPLQRDTSTNKAPITISYGVNGNMLITKQSDRENLSINSSGISLNFTPSSDTILKPSKQIKLISLTIPKGTHGVKMSDTGNKDEIIEEDINCIGIVTLNYTEDKLIESADILVFSLEIWQSEGELGNWGENSGIEGGDGSFDFTSDGMSADNIREQSLAKGESFSKYISTNVKGIHLYSDFSVNSLASVLTSNDFIERFLRSQYNPMSSIISLHAIPLHFSQYTIKPYSAGSTLLDIMLSGYDTKVSANIYNYTVWTEKIASIDLSNIYFGAFPDYSPYTKILLNLPFCGKLEISPSLCMGGSIDIVCSIDFTNGNIVYNIITIDKNGTSIPSYSISGNCSKTIQITGTTSSALAQYFGAGVSAVVAAATGNPLPLVGTATGIFNGLTSPINTQLSSSVKGEPSFIDNWEMWVQISRPVWNNPNKYQQLVGLPCDVSGTINSNDANFESFTGYLKCKSFEAKGIERATSNEKSQIERLLTTGIHI